MELLKRSGIPLAGRTAVVVGRSPVVGRPMAALLIIADATVVVCHSKSKPLESYTRQADVLFAAAGRPGLLHGDMLRPGAVVVDFGINEVDGKLVGDVDAASAGEVVEAITPVPGGTGPVTTAVLARNLVETAWALRAAGDARQAR
jgi:methylenetetrahydrofolate dehydrogenase (NADP+)/methenyltetrahydrofolate cyclohydrolase